MLRKLLPLFFALSLSSLAGCGSAYSASQGAKFEVDSAKEIDDDDVKKAFDASPQLGDKSRVAYFTFDDSKSDDVERMLKSTQHVESVYRIPALLVTGKRRFQETSPYAAPQEVSVKKLRLLAARAHCDVLVVFDHGYKGGGANALTALNIVILPMLFVPFLSNETESYAQAHLIDVRNGYVYGEVQAEAQGGSKYVTIYGRTPKDVFEESWPKILTGVQGELEKRLTPGAKAPPVVSQRQE
jgi:hypothetical protein